MKRSIIASSVPRRRAAASLEKSDSSVAPAAYPIAWAGKIQAVAGRGGVSV